MQKRKVIKKDKNISKKMYDILDLEESFLTNFRNKDKVVRKENKW